MDPNLIRSEDLTFSRGAERLKAYGAWPRRHERLPAVVIVHDVRGLSEHYREIARRFAAEGFFALAVDLYSREGTPNLPTMDSVFAWMQGLDDRRVIGDLDAAVRYLPSRPDVRGRSIGIVGYCMGGQYALMAACQVPTLRACVTFYGMLRYARKTEQKPASPLDLAPNLGCPFLGLFGQDDALIPQSDVEELEAILRRHGKSFQTKSYMDAGHAFFNDTRPEAYRPEVARDAWVRCLTFLHQQLVS